MKGLFVNYNTTALEGEGVWSIVGWGITSARRTSELIVDKRTAADVHIVQLRRRREGLSLLPHSCL